MRLARTIRRHEAASARPRHARALGVAAIALAIVLATAPSGLAAQQVISSSGPLTQVSLGDDLACQMLRAGDSQPAFYTGNNAPGACGTFLFSGSTLYGPPTAPAAFSPAAHTPVSQTPVSGTGTVSDPFKVTTVVDVGSTGLRISRTDSYAVGLDSYRSDITVSNTNSLPATATLYHAGDCVLAGSDASFGFFRAADRGIFCAATANNTPAGRILGFVPISLGSHYLESGAITTPDNWVAMTGGSNYPDVCNCASFQDNGAGVSWALSVPAFGSVTRSLTTGFGATSTPPPPPPTPITPVTKLPDPVLGRSVNVEPVSGKVLVAVPAGSAAAGRGGAPPRASAKGLTFVPLQAARNIPVRSFLDTRHGRVRLVSARNSAGKTQSGIFTAGVFQVLQSKRRSARGLTELRLKGSTFKSCRGGRSSGLGEAQVARRRTIRRLRGSAKGRFRTRGR